MNQYMRILIILEIVAIFAIRGEASAFEDTERLKGVARQVEAATALIGRFGQEYSSAFVISREHRLLATTAHVADLHHRGNDLLAVPSGGSHAYRIERVWYHPGVIRRLDQGLYARSDDPGDGEVSHGGPDIAVLQLQEGGPDLPAECVLATREELYRTTNQAVAHLGFPNTQGENWPSKSKPINSTIVLSNIINSLDLEFRFKSNVTIERCYILQSAVSLTGGFSGGPCFLPNGHVVAINASSDGQSSYAMRIDCLRELLAYHKISHLVADDPGVADGPLAEVPAVGWEPDPRLHRLRQAVRWIDEAHRAWTEDRDRDAIELCNNAVALVPDYAAAYLLRSKIYLWYCEGTWDKLFIEQRRNYATQASDDSWRCLDLEIERCKSSAALDGLIAEANVIQLENNVLLGKALSRTDKWWHEIIGHADDLLGWGTLGNDHQASVIHRRGQARLFLGEVESARQDFDRAIDLRPEEPAWYIDRSECLEHLGKFDLAQSDRKKAEELWQKMRPTPKAR